MRQDRFRDPVVFRVPEIGQIFSGQIDLPGYLLHPPIGKLDEAVDSHNPDALMGVFHQSPILAFRFFQLAVEPGVFQGDGQLVGKAGDELLIAFGNRALGRHSGQEHADNLMTHHQGRHQAGGDLEGGAQRIRPAGFSGKSLRKNHQMVV